MSRFSAARAAMIRMISLPLNTGEPARFALAPRSLDGLNERRALEQQAQCKLNVPLAVGERTRHPTEIGVLPVLIRQPDSVPARSGAV